MNHFTALIEAGSPSKKRRVGLKPICHDGDERRATAPVGMEGMDPRSSEVTVFETALEPRPTMVQSIAEESMALDGTTTSTVLPRPSSTFGGIPKHIPPDESERARSLGVPSRLRLRRLLGLFVPLYQRMTPSSSVPVLLPELEDYPGESYLVLLPSGRALASAAGGLLVVAVQLRQVSLSLHWLARKR